MLTVLESCEAFTSELGHRSFLYPSTQKVEIPKGSTVSRVPWVSISGLMPVKIETEKVFDLCQNKRYKKYSVIWINKENIYCDESIYKAHRL